MSEQPGAVVATLVAPANRSLPPARVRHMFRVLDADGNGALSLDELLTGFEKEFGSLSACAARKRNR